MPNDMSPIPAPDVVTRFTARTRQYCTRAHALSRDPSLTMEGATKALDHLSALQKDIASHRLGESAAMRAQQRRREDPFKRLEGALKDARQELSDAFLRAVPDRANLYGRITHTLGRQDASGAVQQNPVVAPIYTPKPAPTGPPRAISASRALLDLEALRPHLSDAALREAIERYGKANGAFDVTGVAYAALPASANLRCNVY